MPVVCPGFGAYLVGKDYGNPFAAGIGSACTAFVAATKGPCHSNTYFRKGHSDGLSGCRPALISLVVDAAQPRAERHRRGLVRPPAGTYSKAAEAIDAGTGYSGSLSI